MVAAVGNRGKVVEKATPPKRGKLDEVNTQHNSVRETFFGIRSKALLLKFVHKISIDMIKMAALTVPHRSLSVELNLVNQPVCVSVVMWWIVQHGVRTVLWAAVFTTCVQQGIIF